MRKFTFIFCLVLIFQSLSAQVMFIIDSLPDYTPPEDIIYIAGDFQGWNPGDPAYALQKNSENKWYIMTDSVPVGITIEYKFTRGNWQTVEKGPLGEEIPNRQYTFTGNDTVSIIIYNWADYGGGNSTAAENVFVIDEEFYMPQLDRTRRIWIYLPPDYDAGDEHYPVIYMHDGQNLFDTYTSFLGEWEVDEALNELYDEGFAVPIVVGIDNGGTERVNEYTPWINPQYGGGLGSSYIDFIVETLKPFIDDNYRTLPERENTAIWGSSLGGLISWFGILKYQDIFSKAGIYSPSYWWSDSVWMFPQEMGHQFEMKLYQMTGSLEGGTMVPDTWAMHDTLVSLGLSEDEIFSKIVEGGEHNEQLWREDFAETYLWLFHSFANDINEYLRPETIEIAPNPVTESFTLQYRDRGIFDKLFIYDMNGRIVLKPVHCADEMIEVGNLNPGVYFLVVISEDSIYRGKFIKQ